MTAGRELDELVAREIMGWQPFPYMMGANKGRTEYCPPGSVVHVSSIEPLPPYSRAIDAAWQVIEKIRKLYCCVKVYTEDIGNKYECVIIKSHDDPHEKDSGIWGYEETAPLAICVAALKAAGVEVPE